METMKHYHLEQTQYTINFIPDSLGSLSVVDLGFCTFPYCDGIAIKI